MHSFSAARSEVSQIMDHRMMPMMLKGRELRSMHLQIEWSSTETAQDRFSWEPLVYIHKDVPRLVESYFNLVNLDLRSILDREADQRCQLFGNYKKNPLSHNRSKS